MIFLCALAMQLHKHTREKLLKVQSVTSESGKIFFVKSSKPILNPFLLNLARFSSSAKEANYTLKIYLET